MQIEGQREADQMQSEFPKAYNILTNPSEKDINERDDEFAQKYDLFDHRMSGRNSKRSQKNRNKGDGPDPKEQLRKQE